MLKRSTLSLMVLVTGLGLLVGAGCFPDRSCDCNCDCNAEKAPAPKAPVTKAKPSPAPARPAPEAPSADPGVPPGPPTHGGITEIPDDPKLVEKGRELLNGKGCVACHGMTIEREGPPLAGVTERRPVEWIAKMILFPEKMAKSDPVAIELGKKYEMPMPHQYITPEEARAMIAYLATKPSPAEDAPDGKR